MTVPYHRQIIESKTVWVHPRVDSFAEKLGMGSQDMITRAIHLAGYHDLGEIKVHSLGRSLYVEGVGPSIYKMLRQIDFTRKVIHNQAMYFYDPKPPKIGAKILTHQVQSALALGFKSIHTIGGGQPPMTIEWERPESTGYYVWPLYGFNCRVSKRNLQRRISQARREIRKARKLQHPEVSQWESILSLVEVIPNGSVVTLQDLVRCPYGLKFWKHFGISNLKLELEVCPEWIRTYGRKISNGETMAQRILHSEDPVAPMIPANL